jgi:hypothetical protein
MGAVPFEEYADGADVDTAFEEARENTLYENGHGGYTGTIAEKSDYVIVTHTPVDLDQAQALARELIDQHDHRIDGVWGPAGAIPVHRSTRTVVVDDVSGTAADPRNLDEQTLSRLTEVARQRGLVTDGEEVLHGRLRSYQSTRQPEPGPRGWLTATVAVTYTQAAAELTVRESPAAARAQTNPSGWLFFGWASS